MNKGFSIHIKNNQLHLESFLDQGYDHLHLITDKVEIIIEGVVLNKKSLLDSYAKASFEDLLFNLYSSKKEHLVKELEGEFRGMIWDKELNKVFVFTNPTSTQRLFYGKFDDQIFVDSNLVRLSQSLKLKNIIISPNLDAIYQLLCLTGVLENVTIIDNVYKVYDGHWLDIDIKCSSVQEIEYFNSLDVPYYSRSRAAALENLHQVFSESVRLEYQKDRELGTGHLSLLSGGLDSRVAMMYAVKEGFSVDRAFCFSQSNYLDETISRKIAQDYNIDYEFVPLDGGSFLKDIDRLTALSEGLVLYLGAIHVNYAIQFLKFENFSLFHSGQIGDGILGGFNSQPNAQKPSKFKLVFNERFLPQIQESFDKSIRKYETEEACLIRNLAFNRVLLGAHALQQKAYQTSPFMTRDFLKLSKSLPEEWKYKHYFYIDWISKYCPEATQYRWERTMLLPNAKWKTNFGDLWVKRPFVKAQEWIFKSPQKASMYPYQYYFDTSLELQTYYQNYFYENIERLDRFPELKADVTTLFNQPQFYSKGQAVHILAIFKLFFS